MKIKKKIALWSLLCALLVGLVPTCSAHAEDGLLVYDNETHVLSSPHFGYEIDISKYGEVSFYLEEGYKLCIASVFTMSTVEAGNRTGVYCMFYPSEYELACVGDSGHYIVTDNGKHKSYGEGGLSKIFRFYLSNEGLVYNTSLSFKEGSSVSSAYGSDLEVANVSGNNVCVYAEETIYEYDSENDIVLDDVFFDVVEPYTFEDWCADAGLSCSASSNESSSVVPFFYEPDYYNYIVRKTLTASSTSGVYQVTVLQKSDGAHYPYYFEVNNLGYLGIAGAFADVSAFTVRNFYYDADGAGWKLVEKFDVSTLPFDNANVTFTDDVVFIYSDCDIYSDRDGSGIWQSASTGYYNVDIPEPEISRAPIPSPGIDGVEGFVDTAEGLLDMISVVPLMIGAVFGFLPSWCLAIVGIAFSLLVALVVYKLARG